MANLPAKYAFLNTIGVLPKTIQEALKLYGTLEVKGNGNNPAILKWAKDLGIRDYNMDSIPWCGLFAATVVSRAGKDVVSGPLWARNWANFGSKADHAQLGDILVFVRDGGGHVGFYVAESATTYHVLGGNQGDKVCITEIAKNRCIAARRPDYTNKPASVKSYTLASDGHVSVNEG
jgi:uncharacterized protein (TIGR02594 family)